MPATLLNRAEMLIGAEATRKELAPFIDQRQQPIAGRYARVQDFVLRDLPLLITATGGEAGAERYDQHALSEVAASDAIAEIIRNAAQVKVQLNWMAPQLNPAITKFMGVGLEADAETGLVQMLEMYRMHPMHQRQPIEVRAELAPEIHASDQQRQTLDEINQAIAQKSSARTIAGIGESVWYHGRSENEKIGQAANQAHKVEGLYLAEHKGQLQLEYKLEGIDQRVPIEGFGAFFNEKPAYGAIVRTAERCYFVDLTNAEDTHGHARSGQARELIGVGGNDIRRDLLPVEPGLGIIGPEKPEKEPTIVTGHYRYAPIRHKDDHLGPVVITANPWQSEPTERERMIAMAEVQRHFQLYERAGVDSNTTRLTRSAADMKQQALQQMAREIPTFILG